MSNYNAKYKSSKDQEKVTSDLQWFEFETKLRKVVQELLEPSSRRSKEDRELYEILTKKFEEVNKRVADLEFLTEKTQKRNTIFEEIFRRINDLDVSRKGEEKNIMNEIENIKKVIENVSLDQSQMEEHLKTVDTMTVQLNSEFEKSNANLTVYRKNISEMIEEIKKHVIQIQDENRRFESKVSERFGKNDDVLSQIKKTIEAHDVGIVNLRSNLKDNSSRLVTFEKNVEKNNETIRIFSRHIDSIQNTKLKVETIELKQRDFEEFFDMYQPMYIQAQISETLHAVLTAKNKAKLVPFEERKFKEYNQYIIHSKPVQVSQKLQKVNEYLQPILTRNGLNVDFSVLDKKEQLQNLAEGESPEKEAPKPDTIIIEKNPNATNDNRAENDKEKKNKPKKTKIEVIDDDETEKSESSDDSSDQNSGDEKNTKTNTETSPVRLTRLNTMEENRGEKQGDDERNHSGKKKKKIKSKDLKKLKKKFTKLEEEISSDIKKIRDEMTSMFSKISEGQAELGEKSENEIKMIYDDLERKIQTIKDDKTDFSQIMTDIETKIKKSSEPLDKIYAFVKSSTYTFIPLIESLGSVIAILLKEEKEKKTIIATVVKNLNNSSGGSPIFKKIGQIGKKIDLPTLGGSKSPDGDNSDLSKEIEIKFKYNGNLITKSQFLEVIFENFKVCLTYSTKLKLSPNFNHFFESEIKNPSSHMIKFPGESKNVTPQKLLDKFTNSSSKKEENKSADKTLEKSGEKSADKSTEKLGLKSAEKSAEKLSRQPSAETSKLEVPIRLQPPEGEPTAGGRRRSSATPKKDALNNTFA